MNLKLSVALLKLHRAKCKINARPVPDIPMRFVQFLRGRNSQKHLGAVSEDGKVMVPLSLGSCCSNDMITFIKQEIDSYELRRKIKLQPSERVNRHMTLLPPVTNPEKIICVGNNYMDFCEEHNSPMPKEPTFCSKHTNCLVGPTGCIIAHPIAHKIDWEVELAVVIGKTARNVPVERAFNYVFGYCIAQDISARDWQEDSEGHFLIGKSMDTFCPMGPSVVHKSLIPDPHNLNIITKVNGVEKQNSNTSNMIYKIDKLIQILTKTITLNPGDVILTGTPAGVGMHQSPPEYLKPGDVVESEIESIGKLINKVVEAS